MMYLGDFPADQPIYFMWNTNDSSGASITRSVDGAVSVYKDNSDGTSFDQTQTTTGVTNDEDVDALTGVHSCCIATVDAWYETGHDYTVVLSASTIDSQTVNAVIAHFSIENRFMRGTNSAALAATALTNAMWTDAKAAFLDHSIATVDGNVDTLVTRIPDILSLANIESEANDALVALKLDHLIAVADGDDPVNDSIIAQLAASDGDWSGFAKADDSLEAIRDRGDTAWTTAAITPNVLIDTTINVVTDQTHFTLVAGSDVDDAYKDQAIVVYDVTNSDFPSIRKVSAYTGATKTITFDSAPDFTIADGDKVKVFVTAPRATAPTVGEIRTEMEGAGTKLTLALGDTDELQTNQGNWVTAVGFSTHSAADVWTSATRALTDKTGFSLSTAGIKAIWDQLTSALTTVGSIGKLLVDNVNATISSRNSTTPPTVGAIRTEMEGAGTKLTLTLEDTADMQPNQGNWVTATIVALNAQGKLDVNTECDTALSDIKLDHLIAVADGDDPVNDSIIAQLAASDGDWSGFTKADDSLEAIRDNVDTLPSGADIADDVWDEDLAEHTTTNTAGKIVQQIKSVVGAIIGFIS